MKFQCNGGRIAPLLHQQVAGPLLLLLVGKDQLHMLIRSDYFLRSQIPAGQ